MTSRSKEVDMRVEIKDKLRAYFNIVKSKNDLPMNMCTCRLWFLYHSLYMLVACTKKYLSIEDPWKDMATRSLRTYDLQDLYLEHLK